MMSPGDIPIGPIGAFQRRAQTLVSAARRDDLIEDMAKALDKVEARLERVEALLQAIVDKFHRL